MIKYVRCTGKNMCGYPERLHMCCYYCEMPRCKYRCKDSVRACTYKDTITVNEIKVIQKPTQSVEIATETKSDNQKSVKMHTDYKNLGFGSLLD